MKLDEFNYSVPEHLIAQYPLKKRDQARLMIVDRKNNKISHDIFANIGEYLPPDSQIVLNNSKVIPARLLGRRKNKEGEVEIFLLKRLSDDGAYKTLLRPLRRLNNHDQIIFNGGALVAEILDWKTRTVRFNKRNVESYLDKIGHMPLPPYIKRPDEISDKKNYQTVYAKNKGSVASPTAGLHFTKGLISKLKKEGHTFHEVTLHVNYATFKAVEVEDIRQHKMHTEEYSISPKAYKALQEAKEKGQPVVAVGTTSCRVLETVAQSGKLTGETDLFIYPGCQFRTVDILITNFHQPLTTLLMLVYAFGGKELMQGAYAEAIKQEYRFYSYGDGMIIL